MTHKVMVDLFAEKAHITKKDAKDLADCYEEALRYLIENLESGEKVKVADFVIEIKDVPAREGVNPKTGERIQLGATRRLTVKPTNSLKELVK